MKSFKSVKISARDEKCMIAFFLLINHIPFMSTQTLHQTLLSCNSFYCKATETKVYRDNLALLPPNPQK